MDTEDAPRVVSWKLHQGQRFEPSLEAGACWLVVDVEGKEEWPPSSSHINAGQEQQEQPAGVLQIGRPQGWRQQEQRQQGRRQGARTSCEV